MYYCSKIVNAIREKLVYPATLKFEDRFCPKTGRKLDPVEVLDQPAIYKYLNNRNEDFATKKEALDSYKYDTTLIIFESITNYYKYGHHEENSGIYYIGIEICEVDHTDTLERILDTDKILSELGYTERFFFDGNE